MSIGHTISRARTKREMKFSVVDNLASAIIDAPKSTNMIKRGWMIDIPIPNPNTLTGPSLANRVMNFGGGASGSSSTKKLRTARMSSNKPANRKKVSETLLDTFSPGDDS
jgi:hypothetical protein